MEKLSEQQEKASIGECRMSLYSKRFFNGKVPLQQDIGIDNLTAADGLAVGRASGFVGRAMERLLDGFYTLSDQTMYDMLSWLAQEEGIRLEPSALAGMAGPQRVCASVSYQQMHGFSAEQLRNTTHLVWATGGGMVPEEEMNQYLAKGR